LDHGIFADSGRTGDDDQQWFWSIQVEFFAFRHTGLFFMVSLFHNLLGLDYNLEVGDGGIM
jgi:hypothetical protein